MKHKVSRCVVALSSHLQRHIQAQTQELDLIPDCQPRRFVHFTAHTLERFGDQGNNNSASHTDINPETSLDKQD